VNYTKLGRNAAEKKLLKLTKQQPEEKAGTRPSASGAPMAGGAPIGWSICERRDGAKDRGIKPSPPPAPKIIGKIISTSSDLEE